MKKTLWIALILMLICILSLFACDQGDAPPAGDDVCQHAFGDWNTTKQATCKDEGELVRVCSKCSAEEKTTVAKTNVHTEVIDAAVEPTTTCTGLTEGSHCSVCGKILIEQNTIPAIVERIDFDTIVEKYSGIWYLDGYSDVYIQLYETSSNITLQVDAYNFAIPLDNFVQNSPVMPYEVYPYKKFLDMPDKEYWSNGFELINDTNIWNQTLEKYDMSFENDCIYISGKQFVKEKGERDQYYDTCYKEALGVWYLYNAPTSILDIHLERDYGLPCGHYFTIIASDFDLQTLKNDGSDIVGGWAGRKSNWDQYGISVKDDTLTITNENGTCIFYKTPTYKQVTGITLNKQELSLTIGETQLLKATVSPSDAYDTTFNWSSSNSSVATVSTSGIITAKGEGTAIISAITSDGNYIATCEVSVAAVHVTGICISQSSLEMIVGATSQLTATVNPNNATNKSVIWSSSDNSVAQVSSTGQVKAIGKGSATITVTSIDGEYSQTCTVTIKEPELKVNISMGVGYYMSDTSYVQGVFVEISASGGSGFYTDYYIKLYYNGNLVAEVAKDEVVVAPILSGTYTAEVYVKDSSGNEVTATKTTAITK